MIEKRLRKYQDGYKVPDDLADMVETTIRTENRRRHLRMSMKSLGSVAAMFAVAIMLTINPTMAQTLGELPVVGRVFQVISISRSYEENMYITNIETPTIIIDEKNMSITETKSNESVKEIGQETDESQEQIIESGDKNLEEVIHRLNEKYEEESRHLYEAFMADVATMKAAGEEGHLGMDSGYEVKVDDERFFSIARYVVNTVGSSSTVMQYDTVDKMSGYLLTLPSLFKNEDYVENISSYIVEEMKRMMEENDQLVYWVMEDDFYIFDRIDPNQNFYINEDHQMVIAFDKYEVAPGYMGIQEFVIPDEVIEPMLFQTDFLK